MRRIFLLLLLSVLLLPPAAAAQTEEELLDFEGCDYEFIDVNPNEFGDVGDQYNMFGFVQSVNPTYITADFVANEYTIEFYSLESTGFVDQFGLRFINYTNSGMVQVFEDAGLSAASHGINPPNATVPSTFVDGVLLLGGNVEGFGLTLDLVKGTGTFTGDVNFTTGTQVGNIPPNTDRVYTFAGLTSGPLTQKPEGYIHQVAGSIKIELPVPAEKSSWGRMKALYR